MGEIKHLLTIDLEDWYNGIEIPYNRWHSFSPRIEYVTDLLLYMLSEHRVRAVFFVLGWIAERYPALIQKIANEGHTIGGHSHLHIKVYEAGRERFSEDLKRNIRTLEDITGNAVRYFRAPYFSITRKTLPWALEVLAREGIKIDSSIVPVATWRYGLPNAPATPYYINDFGIFELPVSTIQWMGRKWLCGGAYFRLLPYRVTAKYLLKSTQPRIFYIHPWELDPEHPRIWFGFPATLTHYLNLKRTPARFLRLLREVSWAEPPEEPRTLWGKVPSINANSLLN